MRLRNEASHDTVALGCDAWTPDAWPVALVEASSASLSGVATRSACGGDATAAVAVVKLRACIVGSVLRETWATGRTVPGKPDDACRSRLAPTGAAAGIATANSVMDIDAAALESPRLLVKPVFVYTKRFALAHARTCAGDAPSAAFVVAAIVVIFVAIVKATNFCSFPVVAAAAAAAARAAARL